MKYTTPKTTVERLKECLDYNPTTGIFTWLEPTSFRVRVGDVAGSPTGTGHLMFGLDGEKLLNHRWAWYYTYGVLPEMEIDHINGDPADNRLENLRLATRSQNVANTKVRANSVSGVKGVYLDQRSMKWQATIWKNYKRRYIGSFTKLNEAKVAYERVAKEMYGEFAWSQ